jgi:hypothetical protein
MSMLRSFSLGDRAAQETGTAVEVSDLEDINLTFTGTFTATLKLMGSADGVKFAQVGADVTGAASVSVTGRWKQLRLDCSAYTSGTASGRGSGGDVNR